MSNRHHSRSLSPVRHRRSPSPDNTRERKGRSYSSSRSPSPRQRSYSRSPRGRSNSPKRRSPSPRHHSRSNSPKRRSPSPRHHSRKYSSSPRRHRRPPSSPRRRSPSPYSRRRISRSNSPENRQSRKRRSPSPKQNRRRSPPAFNKPKGARNTQHNNRKYQWGGDNAVEEEEEVAEVKVEPNFGLSGKLAAETNTVNGVELKYNESNDSAKPKDKWRLYVFKGDKEIDLLHIHRQSSYLIGRDRAVADIPVDHPSCSKQHAVIQYRLVDSEDTKGKRQKVIKPFIIDLEATNGTFLNGDQIPSKRYVELKPKDILRFGNSSREYVLLRPE